MSVDEATGAHLITNEEIRDSLLSGGEDLRLHSLWHLKEFLAEESATTSPAENVLVFLREAWPRHKKAKSPGISAQLCDLATARTDTFPKFVDTILPLLTPIDSEQHLELGLRQTEGDVVGLYPEKALALLFAILPDTGAAWPFGMDAVLERIKTADPSLQRDRRLLDLRRRWNVQ